jgi:hypothetical protein
MEDTMQEADDLPITNRMLLARLVLLEEKMDAINERLNQASGAWMFIKILGSMAAGLAIIYQAIHTK